MKETRHKTRSSSRPPQAFKTKTALVGSVPTDRRMRPSSRRMSKNTDVKEPPLFSRTPGHEAASSGQNENYPYTLHRGRKRSRWRGMGDATPQPLPRRWRYHNTVDKHSTQPRVLYINLSYTNNGHNIYSNY